MSKSLLLAALLAIGVTTAARAAEMPAGDPITRHGMRIAGVFLQPVAMDPAPEGISAADSDIHLEADIAALADNPNGFGAGDWIPYLSVAYELRREGATWSQAGDLTAMVANDGPHYGANVALDGPGRYELRLTLTPPSANGFARHIDRETGVAPWWEPIVYTGRFVFAGTGKKGGY